MQNRPKIKNKIDISKEINWKLTYKQLYQQIIHEAFDTKIPNNYYEISIPREETKPYFRAQPEQIKANSQTSRQPNQTPQTGHYRYLTEPERQQLQSRFQAYCKAHPKEYDEIRNSFIKRNRKKQEEQKESPIPKRHKTGNCKSSTPFQPLALYVRLFRVPNNTNSKPAPAEQMRIKNLLNK